MAKERANSVCARAVAVSFAVWAVACVAVDRPPAAVEAQPGEVEFQLEGDGAALVVPVMVNGEGPFPFVLDTGATLTCVDEALADRLELAEPAGVVGVGGTVAGVGRMRLVSIDSLEVGGAAATDLRGCAIDLSPMQSAFDVQGLVGLNFLRAYRVTIDFERGMLRLETPDGPAGATP